MTAADYLEEAKKKTVLLKCQWYKKNGDKKNCDVCAERFSCLTMTARRFDIRQSSYVWRDYDIFAENAEEALDLWRECGDFVAELVDEDGEGCDTEMEEVPCKT